MGLLDKSENLSKKGEKATREPVKSVENIGTNIDLVYYAVIEKKSLSLKRLASIFKVSYNKIEEWASVLDKQGLLELYYPVVGDPELRIKKSETKKQENKGKGSKTSKKTSKNKSKLIATIAENKKLIIFTFVVVIILTLVIWLVIKIMYKL